VPRCRCRAGPCPLCPGSSGDTGRRSGRGGGSRTPGSRRSLSLFACAKGRVCRDRGRGGHGLAVRGGDHGPARRPRAPKLRRAVCDAKWAGYAYVTLDGTLIPIDRVAADRPFYSGKHKKHGMNLQVIASPGGDVLRASGRCPGRSTARRPSGPGACWPSWSPRAWSPWPIRDTGAAAGRRSRTGGGTSPGGVPEFRESSRSSLANRPQLSNLAGQLKFRASSTSIGTP
jgi:hypothetical protein